MLLQFSARNFASFKDELILDLIPSSDKSHQENLIVKDKFKGYLMKYCKGKDLQRKPRLDISVSEFASSTVKLFEDTKKLTDLKYVIYDTFISNVMYDEGFRMIDMDAYTYEGSKSYSEIENLNNILVPLIKEQKQSIHHAIINNKNSIMCSEKEIYNLIDLGVLKVRNIDLSRKVRYRSRSSNKTSYKIDKECLKEEISDG